MVHTNRPDHSTFTFQVLFVYLIPRSAVRVCIILIFLIIVYIYIYILESLPKHQFLNKLVTNKVKNLHKANT